MQFPPLVSYAIPGLATKLAIEIRLSCRAIFGGDTKTWSLVM
jgi:hypothetical protein